MAKKLNFKYDNLQDGDQFLEEDQELSRTKRKEIVEELQDLGIELVKTSKDKLAKLDLPDNLLEAIKLAQKITANGAIRRQYQYIGKLMRGVDANQIRQKLNYLNGNDIKATQVLHLSEYWREQLLNNGDTALAKFMMDYAISDISEIRQLVRAVQKEQETNKNHSFTKLFRLIKSIIENHQL